MKVLLVVLGGLAVLVIAALVVAPRFIDWNRYKPEIAALVERATGRRLAIDGDVAFGLLPIPTLSAAGVRLSGAPDAPDLVRLKSLDARIALGPLLGGRLVVESLVLVEPSIVIAGDAAGGWNPALEDRLGFDRVIVVDGSVEWREGGETTRIDRINAEITGPSPSGASIAGPLRISGEADWHGVDWRFDLSTGRLGAPAPVSLSLAGGGASLRLSGTLDPGGARWLTGRLRGETTRLAGLLGAFGLRGPLPAPLGQAVSIEASLEAGNGRLVLNDLAFTLGADLRANGVLDLPTAPSGAFDLTLEINRIDAERWGALLPATAAGAPGAGAAPLPRGALDLTVDAVFWHGGVIRQARLSGVLGGAGLTVKQAGAQLPGGSDIALFGQVSFGAAPRFDGQLEGGADNLRSLFDWLKLDTGGIPADRLRRVSLTAGLSVAADQVELANLDMRFDASRLTGSVVATPGARLALGANLRLDRINLEAYLPRPVPGAPAPAAPAPPLGWLTGFDANLKLRVDQLTYNTLPLQGVMLDATLDGGTLTVHELSTEDAAGLSGSVAGVIHRARWPAELELTATARADDPSRLFELLGYDLATPALGPLTASVSASGPLDHLQLAVDGGLAGASVHALADAADLPGQHALIALSAQHDDTIKLLRALIPAYRPAADTIGPFGLTGSVTLDGARLELADGALTLGADRFGVTARADLADPRLGLALRVTGPSLTLDPLLPRRLGERPPVPLGADLWAVLAGVPDALAGLGRLDATATCALDALAYGHAGATKLALDLALHDRTLTAAHLTADAWGGHVELSATADPAHQPALSARASLTGVQAGAAATALLGVAPLDGRLDLEVSAGASGTGDRALLGSLAGDGRIGLRDGGLDGLDLGALAALRRGTPDAARQVERDLSGGRTAVVSLDAGFSLHGATVATEDAKLVGAEGTLTLRGSLDLAARRVDLGLSVAPAGAPAARVQISGPLDAPIRTLDDQALVDFLSQRPARPAAGARPPSGSGGGR